LLRSWKIACKAVAPKTQLRSLHAWPRRRRSSHIKISLTMSSSMTSWMKQSQICGLSCGLSIAASPIQQHLKIFNPTLSYLYNQHKKTYSAMLTPSMKALLSKVGNLYLLVNLGAQRARDIAQEAEQKGEQLPQKAVQLALYEIAA